MFKLSVIGVAMIAAASASVFQDKMALKNLASNSTVPPYPEELLNDYYETLQNSNVTSP
jgi:hypothetical protein